jgi:hypothetical protein
MTWLNIPSTFIKVNYFWSIFLFLSTQVHYIRFHKYIPIFHFIKWNEIIFFYNVLFRLYSNIICKILWKSFKSLRCDTLKHAHPWKMTQCDTPNGVIIVWFHPFQIWEKKVSTSCLTYEIQSPAFGLALTHF